MTRSLSASEQAALRQHLLQRYGALGRGTPSKAARAKLDGASGTAPLASPDLHAAPVTVLPKDLPRPPFWIRVLGNLSYGATTQSIAEFNALGTTDAQRLANYVDWQLDWANIDDSAVETRLTNAGYTTLGKSLTQLWADHVKPDPAYEIRMRPAVEAQRAALVRAVHSKRQLHEVMVNFWHDHFNVMASDYDAGPVFVHYQRDVLRPQAFGNFRAMLEQVAKSTSMLYFLDNADNTRAGPNENFARELLELHTLGAEHYLGFMDPFQVPPDAEDPNYPAGYTDIDVYETASAFTGWSVKNGHWEYPTENDGSFVYRQAWHDAGPKFLLGRMLYPEQPALKDGRDVLDRLASHPGVARFICKKIIRRFVSDTPDPALVTSAARIFRQNWQAPDQIAKVLRHVLNSSVFMQTWGAKARRPFEAVAAAMRTVGSDWTIAVANQKSDEFNWLMGFTGHSPYDWPAPNGYPDVREAWSGSSSYAMTWRLLNWVTETSESGVPLMPILATTRNKVPSWTATKLVDFWCLRILGYLPTAARRQTLIAFMAQNGDPATYVITDTNGWAGSDLKRHYNQERLRSMVSLILMSPEFLSR
ncbi:MULTISPECIES: DUF1800 domain-containing protein [unclassified Lysobacter]|uniref:DUF1800 domain-containing protein n=1 Tax=unclassified Lysobacter TaxID=2635362 RepID=UPI001BE890A0|nr:MULTISPECIES: DUF1800 domain-containing protein [unclassified Lysobacter]MBT2745277.1 DUF1800 domain-containing protein [Lysobacter sp. ISL-42]MBT2751874.1 DUF1800 domain-containing protein [Lysobacter sp. ISL-50]MBT2777839.1 DUF1800 domain-containing protein [Lysobacter sp. ISL-54]MBT2783095.1 DUF1800 domain-containing protein [Lysobacter sp. ISL-52]